jgi:hypothetical protein
MNGGSLDACTAPLNPAVRNNIKIKWVRFMITPFRVGLYGS